MFGFIARTEIFLNSELFRSIVWSPTSFCSSLISRAIFYSMLPANCLVATFQAFGSPCFVFFIWLMRYMTFSCTCLVRCNNLILLVFGRCTRCRMDSHGTRSGWKLCLRPVAGASDSDAPGVVFFLKASSRWSSHLLPLPPRETLDQSIGWWRRSRVVPPLGASFLEGFIG